MAQTPPLAEKMLLDSSRPRDAARIICQRCFVSASASWQLHSINHCNCLPRLVPTLVAHLKLPLHDALLMLSPLGKSGGHFQIVHMEVSMFTER